MSLSHTIPSLRFLSLFFWWFICNGLIVSAQIEDTTFFESRIDTLFQPEDEEFGEEADSIEILSPDEKTGPFGFIPRDIQFIPPEYLLDKNWNTQHIRINRYDWSKQADTIFIILQRPEENQPMLPIRGKILSPFGYRGRHRHTGVDIKLNKGDTVWCSFDGKVRMAKNYSGYGKSVVIRHVNGLETVYTHLSKILVKSGEYIHAGDPVGLGGRTGRATTNHLHFETRFLEEPFDPKLVFDFDRNQLVCDTLKISRSIFFPARTASSKSKGSKSGTRYHTVRSGDTLYQIARSHGTTVDKLLRLNKMSKSEVLKLGRKIRVR